MITHNREKQTFILENNSVRAVLCYQNGLRMQEFSNLHSGRVSNTDRELLTFTFMGGQYTSADLSVCGAYAAQDNTREMATVLLENRDLQLSMRLHLISDKKDTVTVLLQVKDLYREKVPYELFIHSPFLAAMQMTGAGDKYYYPAGAVQNREGKQLLKLAKESFMNSDIKPPLVVTDAEDQYGFSVRFPSLADLSDDGAVQNRNMSLSTIASAEELHEHSLPINPDATYADTIELEITGLTDGWPEAFRRYRAQWEAPYDFREYDKPDLKWFSEKFLHNFTFLYGTEGFDPVKKKIDVEKLLAEGDEFGGFDTVTVWNQYPRLGIDRRSQWQFFDDFPGGRPAIRQAVEEFHRHGVQVFMPYIPWDAGSHESTDSLGDEFAKLLADTDADGYQLDTLSAIPESFREKCNAVRPGLVMTTQSHPTKKRPMEIITTSWDEFWATRPMPQVDILRYLLPRHIAPVISRWYRKEDKDLLIQYSQFSAVPMVIWQDIFGRWMPFCAEQRQTIKGWKAVYMAHRLTYQCADPIPFWPTRADDVYCNRFAADDGSETIYSFYNDTDSDYTGPLCRADGASCEIILGSGEADIQNGLLSGRLPARTVVHVRVQ